MDKRWYVTCLLSRCQFRCTESTPTWASWWYVQKQRNIAKAPLFPNCVVRNQPMPPIRPAEATSGNDLCMTPVPHSRLPLTHPNSPNKVEIGRSIWRKKDLLKSSLLNIGQITGLCAHTADPTDHSARQQDPSLTKPCKQEGDGIGGDAFAPSRSRR